MPAPRRLARGGRAREAGRVPRRGTGAGPCPGSATPPAARDRGAGARRARRQPHRAHVHRRPQRRLPLRRAAPRGVRQPAHVGAPRRRPRAARRVDHGARPLRAARERAARRRARHLPPAWFDASWRLVGPPACSWRSGGSRYDASGPTCAAPGAPCRAPAARSPTAPRSRRRAHDPVLVPREPAEHVHRTAHAGDARRRPAAARDSQPLAARRSGSTRSAAPAGTRVPDTRRRRRRRYRGTPWPPTSTWRACTSRSSRPSRPTARWRSTPSGACAGLLDAGAAGIVALGHHRRGRRCSTPDEKQAVIDVVLRRLCASAAPQLDRGAGHQQHARPRWPRPGAGRRARRWWRRCASCRTTCGRRRPGSSSTSGGGRRPAPCRSSSTTSPTAPGRALGLGVAARAGPHAQHRRREAGRRQHRPRHARGAGRRAPAGSPSSAATTPTCYPTVLMGGAGDDRRVGQRLPPSGSWP